MTHQEYNTLMRLIELKTLAAVRSAADIDTTELDEEIDELQSVLRAHLCEGDD